MNGKYGAVAATGFEVMVVAPLTPSVASVEATLELMSGVLESARGPIGAAGFGAYGAVVNGKYGAVTIGKYGAVVIGMYGAVAIGTFDAVAIGIDGPLAFFVLLVESDFGAVVIGIAGPSAFSSFTPALFFLYNDFLQCAGTEMFVFSLLSMEGKTIDLSFTNIYPLASSKFFLWNLTGLSGFSKYLLYSSLSFSFSHCIDHTNPTLFSNLMRSRVKLVGFFIKNNRCCLL